MQHAINLFKGYYTAAFIESVDVNWSDLDRDEVWNF